MCIRDRFTLVLAGFLVLLVILLFLRNVSATLIPSLALPISVIGTFAAMYVLGYSLDNLSLLALTLAVGFVVDDAIVMLENIVRHLEAGETPFEAAIKGAREIGFTIVSMTPVSYTHLGRHCALPRAAKSRFRLRRKSKRKAHRRSGGDRWATRRPGGRRTGALAAFLRDHTRAVCRCRRCPADLPRRSGEDQ